MTAMPASDGRHMDNPLFKIALRRRIRAPVFASDGFCVLCGGCSDKYGDHAIVCPCRGDRTVRHNEVRNIVFQEAVRAGVGPEKEKAGLLPARPAEDGLTIDGARRPADIWLPRSQNGRGEALDFAVTSGMRGDLMQVAEHSPEEVVSKYEEFKKTYKNALQQCLGQGFDFTPFIFEAHSGSWSLTARRVLDRLASQQKHLERTTVEDPSLRIAQRISISLHRENARAVLRRVADPVQPGLGSSWADFQHDSR